MNQDQFSKYSAKSIVVLPFVNMSSDPENEYFSDGISEEIINALTTVDGLKVIARTSSFAFKGKNVDVRTIGNQLGVNTVLEGSIRKVKNNVRITAQLIRTDNGSHLWSQNFDRELEDIFAVQDEISLLIADKIRENFGHFDIQDHLVEAPTHNMDAYNLHLKGRFHQLKWNAKDLLKAIDYYEQSIEKDPQFALPYFSAGLTYGIVASWGFYPYDEGLKKAEQFLSDGLILNNESYLGYFARGSVCLWGNWNFKSGLKHLSKAVEINHSFTDAEEGLAELYTATGNFEQALHHTDRILGLNPLSPNHYYTKGNIHYLSKEYDVAIECFEACLKIDPEFSLAIELIAACYILLNDYARLDAFLTNNTSEKPKSCRAVCKLMYPDENVDFDLNNGRTLAHETGTPSLVNWELYVQVYLGHHELALNILENAVNARNGQFINFKNDPFLEPLRNHERFKKLATSIFESSQIEGALRKTQDEVKEIASPMSDQEAANYLAQITTLLNEEQLYLDSELCLKTLAEELDLHPNKLSWFLNEHIGKNFNEYINSFRLQTFKEKALNPANSHFTVLGLAYESGFNSKTAFNTFFKKAEGTTPSLWMKAAKEASK